MPDLLSIVVLSCHWYGTPKEKHESDMERKLLKVSSAIFITGLKKLDQDNPANFLELENSYLVFTWFPQAPFLSSLRLLHGNVVLHT
jgi:hypothetical protein